MSATATRAARRCRVAKHLRTLSTSAATVSQPSHEEVRPKTWKPKENLRLLHPRMIFVRPWDGVPTMAHAFALVREIERRFGKIQEFVVLRDSDVPTNNLPYMHATFARAEYADAIPLEGRVIQVPLPSIDPAREGGVGLDDLEVYLDPGARAQELAKSSQHVMDEVKHESGPDAINIVMDVKLERSGMRDSPPPLDIVLGHKSRIGGPPILRRSDRYREIADAILSFGGFASVPKRPMDSTKPKTRMQLVMERWGLKEEAVANAAQPVSPDVPSAEPVSVEVLPAGPIPWEPFPQADCAQDEASSLPPASSPSESMPPAFATPSPPSHSTTPSKPPSASEAKPPLPIPKVSKKQRMLHAARLAGAQAASRPAENDFGSLQEPTEPALESDAEDTVKRVSDNNRAARRWWNFLTGSKE